MTKRIVSGIFVLTALGALGVILAGALTSGEQLIVRFLTAVIVAALGLYVISDLRLQADDDTAGGRVGATTHRNTVSAPPNSTAAFMATVTRRNDAATQDEGDVVTPSSPPGMIPQESGTVLAEPIVGQLTDDASAIETVVVNDEDDAISQALAGVGAATASTADLTASGSASSAGSDRPDYQSPADDGIGNIIPESPPTVRDDLLEPSSVDISDLFVDQGPAGVTDGAWTGSAGNGRGNHDAATPNDGVGEEAADDPLSPVGAHDAVTPPERERVNGADIEVTGDHDLPDRSQELGDTNGHNTSLTAPFSGRLSESALAADGVDPVERLDGPAAAKLFDINGHKAQNGRPMAEAHPVDETPATNTNGFEYSGELQADVTEWPGNAATTSVPEPSPFEKASAAYEAAKRRVEEDPDNTTALPVVAASNVTPIGQGGGQLAPIIDLRDAVEPTPDHVDAAINAGEVEVVATLIEQGMLNTSGPITDSEVRTMVYVAFTSNELRKLLVAGGNPEGPNHGLDLGPVELFDERIHTPAPKTLYSGAEPVSSATQLG